jgi:hypothetical protein
VTSQNICKMIFVSGDCNFGVYNNMWTAQFWGGRHVAGLVRFGFVQLLLGLQSL